LRAFGECLGHETLLLSGRLGGDTTPRPEGSVSGALPRGRSRFRQRMIEPERPTASPRGFSSGACAARMAV
jgi:hypothetical protein